jgi:membrane protein
LPPNDHRSHSLPYRIAAMIVATVKDWLRHRATSKSAALAFYALFSLAPLFILLVSISGFFVGNEIAEGAIFSQMRTVLGDAFSDEIRRLLLRAIESGYRGRANVIASFLLLFASTSALAELKVSLDLIWEEPSSTIRGFLPWLRRNLLAFALILALALLLLLSLLISTALQSVGRLWIDLWPAAPILLRPLSSVLSFMAIAILFAIIYKTLPQRRLDAREVLVGALTSAVLFHIGRVVISAYINRAWLTTVYEAAGSIVVLTAWVYYSALVFLFGAELTRNYSRAFGADATCSESEG